MIKQNQQDQRKIVKFSSKFNKIKDKKNPNLTFRENISNLKVSFDGS